MIQNDDNDERAGNKDCGDDNIYVPNGGRSNNDNFDDKVEIINTPVTRNTIRFLNPFSSSSLFLPTPKQKLPKSTKPNKYRPKKRSNNCTPNFQIERMQ